MLRITAPAERNIVRWRPVSNLLIATDFWPRVSNPISGVFVTQQIAALCRAGYSVTALVGRVIGKRADPALLPEALGLPVNGVSLRTVPLLRMPEALSATAPAFAFNIRSIGLSMAKTLTSLASGSAAPTGCIVHGLRYYAFAAPHWAPLLQARKIAFVHGVDPFLTKSTIAGAARTYLTQAEPHFDRLAIVGSPLRSHIEDIGGTLSKAVIVPNGTDIPPLAALQPNADADGGSLNIVSVSNLVALKGIDDNLRALSVLSTRHGIGRWRYTIVGDGTERERLTTLAASLGLKGQVRFLGRLSYADTMREIEKADIFSLPSWGEAFGIVYLEAMARKRPAIGCLGNGAADIITNGEDGLLVPPKDPEAVALALKRLFDRADLRKAMGERARKTAERYSWDANARHVLDLLQL